MQSHVLQVAHTSIIPSIICLEAKHEAIKFEQSLCFPVVNAFLYRYKTPFALRLVPCAPPAAAAAAAVAADALTAAATRLRFLTRHMQAPTFLTIQVSRSVLNEAICNLNAYAAPRLETPSELLLTVDEITAIIGQGELSRTLLLSAAHLKRVEVSDVEWNVVVWS